jgi:hypothetical protein
MDNKNRIKFIIKKRKKQKKFSAAAKPYFQIKTKNPQKTKLTIFSIKSKK